MKLIPRLQNYYLFINTFDCLDYGFISKLNKIIKFKNCELKMDIFLSHTNVGGDGFMNLFMYGLNLEGIYAQRFYSKFKNIIYSFDRVESFRNTIRGRRLYEFLEYCRNSIFIDKLVKMEENQKNNYEIRILDRTQWNEFRCNSFILNYFFYNKLDSKTLIFINFTSKRFNLNKKFLKLNLLPCATVLL